MPTMKEYFEIAERKYMFVSKKPPVVMEKGKGMYLWDVDGRRYLDFISGWAVTLLGHCHPSITRALVKQGKKLINASPAFYNKPQVEFTELLLGKSCMDRVFFVSSGAEANEGAIKLARKYGSKFKNGAYEIITTRDSFHGRTLATMAATGKEHWQTLYAPTIPGFIHLPYNDLAAVEKTITDKTIAVMIEPVQGESGAIAATKEYIQGLRKLCDEKGILLIFDEIQTGYCRTGSFFAYEQFGVEPDIMTLAKGIGGGYPLGALLAKEKFCVFEAGDQGGTYTGQPLAMAVGLAVLREIIKTDLPSHVKKMSEYLVGRLRELEAQGLIANIRGMGLLIAFDAKRKSGADIVNEALEKGLLLNSPRPTSIRLMPALIAEKKHIDEMIKIISTIL
ncbi:MAG TPA: acetylornithine/succinylornithine family transaminase [Spirochaetota bacterium]